MMDDKQIVQDVYKALTQASIDKDADAIKKLLAEDYVLVHMTGVHQTADEYIAAVMDGTLNYYSAEHQSIKVTFLDGYNAEIDGKSIVSAAVYGGGLHTWRLRQKMKLRKEEGKWKVVKSQASTY